ncbi:MAG TPA: Stk1 family PASTA domain-containing Ser/Thr kinase [Trebonia sp.]|nr:Stk1 family PASTA domain-containing Ser/Thr kinase [Trebonia sp.]
MESALADALLGRVLDRRYHVRSRIAHGGMATVYLATDKRLDRQVALKVMHAELARDEEFVSRFIGEAKSVARLSHPNVVAVFDQGSDGQYLYLAMEYVPGRTLRSLLRERGAFPPDAALSIMEPILSGLAAAHAAGIVHRDVKPENVLLTADGRLKVVDFGLAQAQAATGQTREGVLIGTVAYIAPEQVTGRVTDFRTDVYAAGVVLFELLTGSQPYSAESPLQVAYKHVNSEVPAPSDWAQGIPPAVDLLVRSATSRDPRLRPADAGTFLRAVNAVRAGADPAAILAGAPARPAPPRLLGAPPTRPERFGRAAYGAGSYTPAGPQVVTDPYGRADGNSHTTVVPGGLPGASQAAGWGGGRGWDDRSTSPGHREPFLERWLFSRRLAYLAAGVVAVILIVFAGWYLTSGRYTPIPSVAGLSASQAESMLTSDGFKVRVGPARHSNDVTTGDVISTSPSGQATGGSTIVVTVSSGPKMITVPPVTGHSLAGAIALLRNAGLMVASTPQNIGATGVAVGTVAGTTPASGTSWPANKTVFVQVVAGPPVPNLVGQSFANIQTWAQQNGVNLVQQQVASTQQAGIILSQSPAAGGVLTQGETITVKVSNGPPMVPVPNVQGQNINQATQALQQAGFQVSAQRVGFGQKVVLYSPTGTAPQGSTIKVYYGL